MKKNNQKSKRGKKSLFVFLLVFISGFIAISAILYFILAASVPNIVSLQDYQPQEVNYVYSNNGKLVGYLGSVNREVVPLSRIPLRVREAFLAAEDKNFYNQGAIDFKAIVRAFFVNILSGHIVEGGSTITQQVAKTLLIPYQRSYIWKLREAILAYRIAGHLSKDEILDIYLNQIYLGNNAYGVQAASLTYFDVPVWKLDLAQAAMLGGLPQAPSYLDPYIHFKDAKRRQKYVLTEMAADGFITEKEAKEAYREKITLHNYFKYYGIAPYYLAYVKQDIIGKYGKEIYKEGGLKIYTAMSARAQKYADKAVKEGLIRLSHEYGYSGPLKKLSYNKMLDGITHERSLINYLYEGSVYKGFVTGISSDGKYADVAVGRFRGIIPLSEMSWASAYNRNVYFSERAIDNVSDALGTGDEVLVRFLRYNRNHVPVFSLEENDIVQGALISINPQSGYVIAMVGGYSYKKSQFNRAIDALRQTGSAFKPFVYAQALSQGFTPSSIINNTPVVYPTGVPGKYYRPKNFERNFTGPTTLITGLSQSIDVVAIKLLKRVGIDNTVDLAHKMGLHHLVRNLTLALGSSSLSLLDITNAYTAFANGGQECEPVFITKILTPQGKTLFENTPQCQQVLSPQVAFILTNMMERVISGGTGSTVSNIRNITPDIAGKTGSSSDYRDGVFIGYTSTLVTGVWTGLDNFHSMGKLMVGAITAAPIWDSYMSSALAVFPPEPFTIPSGIVFVDVDPSTGLVAPMGYKDPLLMPYIKGTEPGSVPKVKKAKKPWSFFNLF